MRRDGGLLIDGSLLDNLPLEPMSYSGEGPVLAIDIKGGEERPRPAGDSSPTHACGRPGASGAPALAAGDDGADRAAIEREHRRGRAPATPT